MERLKIVNGNLCINPDVQPEEDDLFTINLSDIDDTVVETIRRDLIALGTLGEEFTVMHVAFGIGRGNTGTNITVRGMERARTVIATTLKRAPSTSLFVKYQICEDVTALNEFGEAKPADDDQLSLPLPWNVTTDIFDPMIKSLKRRAVCH